MPIRDLLVTIIVFGALPYALRHPWIGVILWTWLSVMNPHRLGWGFAHTMPFAAMAAGVTLIALLITKDKVKFPRSGAAYLLIAFIAWMGVTTIFAIHFNASLTQLNKVIKIQLMTLVGLAVIQSAVHIRWFVWANAVSLGFFGLKGGLYTIQTAGGGRVWGPGGFIGGNNEIGLAMLVIIPLLYYLYITSKNVWLRWGLIATMVLSLVAAIGTQSRGAMLAAVAMGALLWWRSPVNKVTTGIAVVAVGVSLFAFMPQTWHDRMATIQNYEADGSAMGRLYAWETAINIANRRPTGAGFEVVTWGIFAAHAPRPSGEQANNPLQPRAAHSIYFQVLGEHGWIGLALFVAIWIKLWRDASQIRRLARPRPELRWARDLAGMCQVSLLGYGVGGAFLSLAYFDLPYNLLIIVVTTQRVVLEQLKQQPALGALAGPTAAPQPWRHPVLRR